MRFEVLEVFGSFILIANKNKNFLNLRKIYRANNGSTSKFDKFTKNFLSRNLQYNLWFQQDVSRH